MRSRFYALGATFAVTGPVLIGLAPPAAAANPTPPQNAAATSTGSTATISWQAPTSNGGSPLDYYTIVATDSSTGAFFGTEHACGTCTSIQWPALVLGHSYSFAVSVTNTSGASSSAATTTLTTPLNDCAGASGLCVTADSTSLGAANAFPGQGLLDTGANAATNSSYLSELGVRQWRMDGNQGDATLADIFGRVPTGASTSVILFDAWNSYQQSAKTNTCLGVLHNPANPWDNWTTYDNWVKSFVSAQEQAGRKPDYWDVMNEPAKALFQSNALCTQAPSLALAEQVFQHTYADIKNNPQFSNEKLVAPSLSVFNESTELDSTPDLIPFNQFLKFSDANGLQWDALSFHDFDEANNTGSSQRDYLGLAQAVQTHLVEARQLIANHPSLSNASVFVNEYNGPGNFSGGTLSVFNLVAGRTASLLAALTNSGADQANLACWPDPNNSQSDCFNGSLDGMLDPSTGLPRSAWWVHRSYADMAGKVAKSGSTDQYASVLAVFDSASATARLLLGRFDYNQSGPAANVTVKVRVPAGFGSSATVTTQQIPNTSEGTLTSLPAANVCMAAVQGGVMQVTVPGFGDNDAYLLTAAPLSGSHPPC